ncbi:SH3 domain-containing protein [Aquibacillus sediminis]|uniref:SH3 domain-containing protein n=1 Tax=Aquibacillus sediminis TaxID=2574734 RepID=UPI001107BBED|nr:SH3 domain-containing protein [Aquibacillus sediminis]
MPRWLNNKIITMIIVVISMVTLLAPKLTSAAYSHSFTDVKEGSTFYEPIMELTKQGVISGYSDGTFRGKETLQRRHGAVLLYHALDMQKPADIDERLSEYYDDVWEGGANADEIAAVTPSVFKGSDRLFHPNDNMTREEVATTFVRAFDLYDNGTDPGMNLSNVSPAHKQGVEILAQYEVTDALDDFKPKETITREEFSAFLYRIMNQSQEKDIRTYTSYDSDFDEVINTQMDRTPKVDGAGAFLASEQLVEHYANPNNFSEDTPEFFQFLLLSYSDGLHADEINQKILKGKGSLEGTAEAFIKAGKKYNINVIYLIAHALHETANGTSTLSTGYPVSEVDGEEVPERKTYNMYGIKAYDSTPLESGSEYAYEQEWFTKEDSIIGGAKFINSGYIGEGQDTLYKMRWNPDSPGDHQYATHVNWATIQAENIQKMYEVYNLIDHYVLKFDIPTYDNLPEGSPKPSVEAQYVVDEASAGWIGETTDNLNLRVAPSTSKQRITTIPEGTEMEVIGENGGWYNVDVDDEIGWVTGEYVEFTNLLLVDDVGSSVLNVRNEPSTTDSTVVGKLEEGDPIVGVKDELDDFTKDGEWYKVTYNGEDAWVHGDYVKEDD